MNVPIEVVEAFPCCYACKGQGRTTISEKEKCPECNCDGYISLIVDRLSFKKNIETKNCNAAKLYYRWNGR